MPVPRVNIHGGHSGQFCCHAHDELAAIVQRYVDLEYRWIGLTEHVPAFHSRLRYDDEIEAQWDVPALQQRFAEYVREARRLQKAFRYVITIGVGWETELVSGYYPYQQQLIKQYQPDYVVGSVHHVDNINFDFSSAHYEQAVAHCGGMEALYCAYFDAQYTMLRLLQPLVVGHFDVIRLYDPAYRQHLALSTVWARVQRNLDCVAEQGVVLDVNLRAIAKGAPEPYPAEPIIKQAVARGIRMIPGDDSHAVADVGAHWERGLETLRQYGCSMQWSRPPW